ncbi:MAG: suppressor of fused domain protein [Lachnospiraceae bacterium]|nr:suppressor of fused domain protein [Lachnospiraceae bacterium]
MGFLDKFKQKFAPKAVKVTEGGSSVYHYEEKERGYRAPVEYGKYSEEICAHFEMLFPDREEMVFHEAVSDLVHIDVYVRKPNDKQNFYVIYTTGMSDLPMCLPKEISKREDLKYAELYTFLPSTWNCGENFKTLSDLEAKDSWIIQYIRFLARFPHEYETWLGHGHTLPNGPEYAPLCENTKMGGIVLSQGGGDIECVKTKDGKEINLLMAIPAYQEEIEYKLKYGMDALEDIFSENKMPLTINMSRPNYCSDFKERLD